MCQKIMDVTKIKHRSRMTKLTKTGTMSRTLSARPKIRLVKHGTVGKNVSSFASMFAPQFGVWCNAHGTFLHNNGRVFAEE